MHLHPPGDILILGPSIPSTFPLLLYISVAKVPLAVAIGQAARVIRLSLPATFWLDQGSAASSLAEYDIRAGLFLEGHFRNTLTNLFCFLCMHKGDTRQKSMFECV